MFLLANVFREPLGAVNKARNELMASGLLRGLVFRNDPWVELLPKQLPLPSPHLAIGHERQGPIPPDAIKFSLKRSPSL